MSPSVKIPDKRQETSFTTGTSNLENELVVSSYCSKYRALMQDVLDSWSSILLQLWQGTSSVNESQFVSERFRGVKCFTPFATSSFHDRTRKVQDIQTFSNQDLPRRLRECIASITVIHFEPNRCLTTTARFDIPPFQ